jgi:hypothetical protein
MGHICGNINFLAFNAGQCVMNPDPESTGIQSVWLDLDL